MRKWSLGLSVQPFWHTYSLLHNADKVTEQSFWYQNMECIVAKCFKSVHEVEEYTVSRRDAMKLFYHLALAFFQHDDTVTLAKQPMLPIIDKY